MRRRHDAYGLRARLTRSALRSCGSYVSIPQANKTLQLLAIESLATYASLCSYFLVLAPNAVHVDTLKQCDTRTYSRRGWW